MKTKLHYIATALFLTNIATAQVLYTENFDNLSVGNLGTDITGQTPGQGGWYTLAGTNSANYPVGNSDFKITPETNKGNVLELDLPATNTGASIGRSIFREDILLFWNNRTPNHNIFKLSFDFYTSKTDTKSRDFGHYIALLNKKEQLITNLYFDRGTKELKLFTPYLRNSSPSSGGHTIAYLATDSWVTIELLIDYNTNKFYVSIPSLNLTQVFNSVFPLSLTDPVSPEDPTVNDSPVKLWFWFPRIGVVSAEKLKFDNINISATNVAPTVSISNFVSNKFNLYPNPATDVVTITNNENINIEKVEVYDVTSKRIHTYTNVTEYEIQLNIEKLNIGTYFLHITTNQGLGIKKFIKQ